MRRDAGQASILLIGGLAAVLIGAFVFAAVGRGMTREGDLQRAADLAALAGARAMHDTYTRLFEPVMLDHRPNPQHLDKDAYLALGARSGRRHRAGQRRTTARRCASRTATRSRPCASRSSSPRRFSVGEEAHASRSARRRRARAAGRRRGFPEVAAGGGYDGPLAYRQGKPMRPDVALAFDRMDRAARADGVALVINSAFRSDAEQAELWRRHPDPRWVAPPGQVAAPQRHGARPRAARRVRLAGARTRSASTSCSATRGSRGTTATSSTRGRADVAGGGGAGGGAARSGAATATRGSRMPGFVPARFAPMIARAAQRWNVSAALLAAQLYAESNFNPFARSSAGRAGDRAVHARHGRALGLDNPFDAERAIDAQAHLMRDLLRRFGSVPLALAAYNAGPRRGRRVRLRAAVRRDARLRREDPRPDERRRRAGRRRARRRADRAAHAMTSPDAQWLVVPGATDEVP